MLSSDEIHSNDRLAASALLALGSATPPFPSDDSTSFGSDDPTALGSDDTVALDFNDAYVPKTLSQIDQESDAEDDDATGGNCDFCGDAVGPKVEVQRRFFRCIDCGTCLQCENCCFEMHLCHPRHQLEVSEFNVLLYVHTTLTRFKEWKVDTQEWLAIMLEDTGLHKKYAMHCSSCCKVISRAGEPMAIGTLICRQCGGDGLLCEECCVEDHASKPLHRPQVSLLELSLIQD
jgi:hypothetical protein